MCRPFFLIPFFSGVIFAAFVLWFMCPHVFSFRFAKIDE